MWLEFLFKRKKEMDACSFCRYYIEKDLLCSYMKIRVLPRTAACIHYKKRE